MSSAHGIRMKKPVHPGRFVKHEIIEALDLSVTGAARALQHPTYVYGFQIRFVPFSA